jgi:hypothetical protein
MEHKFLKGHHLGHRENINIFNGEVEISEKLDGANMSVLVGENGELICRSRNRELSGENKEKMFSRAKLYLENIHAVTPFSKGQIMFGENMVKHTIFYGSTPAFIGYAVFDIATNRYIEDWYTEFDKRGIPRVDFFVQDNMTAEDLNEFLNRPSAWGTENVTAEGIFIKNYGDCENEQIFGKVVVKDFLEKNAEVFGAPKSKMNDTAKVINMYCTIPRIKKGIFKLRNEYNMELNMTMMKYLPLEVYNDILEEEIIAISKKFGTINFKKMRKMVSSMCAVTLKDFMLEQMNNMEG